MKTRIPLTLLLMLVAAPVAVPAGPLAQSTDEILLKQALDLEKAKGDVAGAIEIYRRLAGSKDAKIAGTAKVELARLLASRTQAPVASADSEFGRVLDVQSENYMTVSPDGRLLGRLRRAGTPGYREPSLVVVDFETGQDRLLATLRGNTRATRFSPDGKWLAAQVGGIKGLPQTLDLVIAPVNGAGQVISIPDLGSRQGWPINTSFGIVRNLLEWSPDSVWLPFVAPTEAVGVVDVRLLDVTTGRHESLNIQTDMPADFQWSPSGMELAMHVSSGVNGTNEIRIINPRTGASRRMPLPAGSGRVTRLAQWTTKNQFVIHRQTQPDVHESLLFDPEKKTLVKTCASRVPYQAADGFPEDDGDLCREITPDGSRQLTWQFEAKRLMVRDTSTGVEQALTSGGGHERAAFLAPDGRHVLFLSNRDGEWGLYSTPIDRAPNAQPVRFARLPVPPQSITPRWTGNGVVMDFEFIDSNIMRVPVPGRVSSPTAPERLTQDRVFNSRPASHPESSKVAYWSSSGGGWAVTVMDADGARERVVSEVVSAVTEEPPLWQSRDQVLVARRDTVWSGTGLVRFVSVDVRTGEQTGHGTVTLGAARWDLVPHSQEVIYQGKADGTSPPTLRAFSIATGIDREFARFDEPGWTLNRFVVSPDGSRVAYQAATRRGQRAGILMPGSQPVDFATGAVNASPVAWSNDGRHLLAEAGQPVVIDVATGAITPILAPNQKIDWTGEGSWSPDDSFIYLTVRGRREEWRRYPNVDGGGR